MKAKYTCNKCNHVECKLTVDDNEDVGELDTPEWCVHSINFNQQIGN